VPKKTAEDLRISPLFPAALHIRGADIHQSQVAKHACKLAGLDTDGWNNLPNASRDQLLVLAYYSLGDYFDGIPADDHRSAQARASAVLNPRPVTKDQEA
jgi:hypothetical protein